MSKKKTEPAVPEEVVIRNWDDWFNLCGKLVQPLSDYEADMVKYFFEMKHKKTDGEQHEAQMEYQAKHKRNWFKEEPKIPSWYMSKIGIGLLAGLAVGFLLALFLMVQMGFGTIKTTGIAFAVIGAVLGGLAVVQSYTSKTKRIFSHLEEIETQIEKMIMFIPPKYRNKQSVEAFYDVYCSYGIASFNQAVVEVDNYLVSNNLVGAYMAVMHDMPYTNDKNGNASGDGPTGGDATDPALPPDITEHTFEGTEHPDDALDALVGLENVKTQVRQMKNRMDFYGQEAHQTGTGNHMVFLGPPGTGKTTIARIITRILYDFGYIKENRIVEIDGGYMKSPYVGQTAERANAILKYSMGGVLFIDEAYILTEDKNNSQGAEAVGVLLKAMEDHRSDFVCILAGYEDNMNRMLSSNEGFASRIKHKIYFDNFSVEDMMNILKGMMRSSGLNRYKIEREAYEILEKHFEKERRTPGFGNARVVRNTWDSLLDVHADAFQTGQLPEEKRYVITKEDVLKYTERRQKQMVEDGRNFIASRNLDSSVISLQELKGKTKRGSEDPDADLNALTGLSVVKNEMKRMKTQFEFYDGKMENKGNHMVFLGPPGTGKTTVAAIVTGYLYKMGLIQENAYLDINGDFLRGMYLGHTGKRTEAVVQYSQGMVLFVDEAYLLTSNDGSADAFGQEAVGVLIDAMEKYRKNFVVIFAGYEKEMTDFLDVNSGLASRISLTFHFQSYTPHELAQMMKNVAKADGFTVAQDVWIPLQQYFKTQLDNPRFGNGRFVRQFFESAKKSHIVNYADGKYDEDKKFAIQLADVEPLFDNESFEEQS